MMFTLFGGTFDPIHEGHLHLATEIAAHFPIKTLFFIPAQQNPHKAEKPDVCSDDRLQMLHLALREMNNPKFSILNWELNRTTPSYTVLTLERFVVEYKQNPALVMGNEVFQRLSKWYRAEKVIDMADLIVINRQEMPFEPEILLKKLKIRDYKWKIEGQKLDHSGNRRWIEQLIIQPLPHSASLIREEIYRRWQQNDMEHPPQGIQRSVWQYIKEKRLYSVTKREG
ncbi:MAG: nicotinate (nicotinamide) nucleotide adenylyltransferase [Deltaproteobacteria bacterium]|nr:nicotinate (nicotinamide) nucleotide adenylyltransferase [Deltaproteobacteria bacterium]